MSVPPPPGLPPEPTPEPLVAVGAPRRIAATLVDFLFLVAPTLLLFIALGVDPADPSSDLDFRTFVANLVATLGLFAYMAWFESAQGATPGKRLLSIHVVGPDGYPPSQEAALRRNAWLLPSIIPVVGGLIQFALVIAIIVSIHGGPFHRGLHDRYAGGTAVVHGRSPGRAPAT